MFIQRDPRLTEKARELRKNMTPWERRLWYNFLRTCPARFQRQKPIGAYIVDFYCSSFKLVIEVDGGQHFGAESRESDARRTADLEGMGLRVLRYSNLEVDRNFEGVCADILRRLQEGGAQALL